VSGKKHSTHTLNVTAHTEEPLDDWKRFVEIPYFQTKWKSLGLTDDDLRALQLMLTASPQRFPVIAGTGGLRKVRFARVKSSRGKSGSFRIGYVYFEEFGVIGLIAVYAKKDQATIPPSQKPAIKQAIQALRDWVAKN